jgi:uncharacterized DUF497 family protein
MRRWGTAYRYAERRGRDGRIPRDVRKFAPGAHLGIFVLLRLRDHSRRAVAATVLFHPLELTDSDPVDPVRSISIGISSSGRLLVVVYLEQSDTIRIISAREATRSERRTYEEGT